MASESMTYARERGLWLKTPLVESTNLSKAAGCKVFLKLDNLQPSGSFKSRGLGHFCSEALNAAKNAGRVHFYSSSGGNAGLACVSAANILGYPSTVVVPLSTKPMMVAKIAAAGAEQVIQFGATWQDADQHLREVVMAKGQKAGYEAIYVNPFNHKDIWRGHESVVEEIREQWAELDQEREPDVIVCSVGGGGLLCGVLQGLEKAKWNTMVLALETEGAASLGKSLEQGEHITLPDITSQATTLGARRVADRAFELARAREATGRLKSVVLSDAEAAMGCWRFADDERTLVELSCGVNLALCYDGRLSKALGRPVRPTDKVVIEVCGGSMVNTQMVEHWRQEFGILNGAFDSGVPSATTAP